MKTQKMSLANIQGKLSRAEMKNIMAGSGGDGTECSTDHDCGTIQKTCSGGTTITVTGYCYTNSPNTKKTCHYGGCPS